MLEPSLSKTLTVGFDSARGASDPEVEDDFVVLGSASEVADEKSHLHNESPYWF